MPDRVVGLDELMDGAESGGSREEERGYPRASVWHADGANRVRLWAGPSQSRPGELGQATEVRKLARTAWSVQDGAKDGVASQADAHSGR
jgi:hypothetical protein